MGVPFIKTDGGRQAQSALAIARQNHGFGAAGSLGNEGDGEARTENAERPTPNAERPMQNAEC